MFFSIMSKLLYQESTDLLLSEFAQVRKKTMQLFKPLRIEDAVMQSDPFGSPPNWHIAHVSWFFQKVLEKHGATLESDNSGFNLEYLNSYYQQFGKILPKQERGKFPRPTVKQTLDYRSFIDRIVTKFLKEKSTTFSENSNAITHELPVPTSSLECNMRCSIKSLWYMIFSTFSSASQIHLTTTSH